MENKAHAMAAGAFVLLLSALLILLAYWLGRDNAQLRVFELSSPDAVTGLQPQASVRYKGVNVGRVIDIALDPQKRGNVLVRITVNDSAPITASTFATLGFQGLTGLAFIQLDDSGESSQVLPLATSSSSQRIPLRRGLMAQLGEQGSHILGQLDQASTRLNQVLTPENQVALLEAIHSIGKAASRLDSLGQDAQRTMGSMRDSAERLGRSAESVNVSATAFKAVSLRMTQPGGTLDQLGLAGEALGATSQTLNATLAPLISRAVSDAGQAARDIGRAASAVQDNPQSLLWGPASLEPGPGERGFRAPVSAP